MSEVERLEAELAKAKEAATAEGKAALEALPREYDYFVRWKSQYVFYCYKRLSDASYDAYIAWQAKYPDLTGWSLYRLTADGKAREEGMEYVLIGNLLVQVGGGTLVLKATDDKNHFSHEPKPLTDDEATSLRAGVVPDNLKL